MNQAMGRKRGIAEAITSTKRAKLSCTHSAVPSLSEHCLMEIFSYLELKVLLLRTSLVNKFWRLCSEQSLLSAVGICHKIMVYYCPEDKSPKCVISGFPEDFSRARFRTWAPFTAEFFTRQIYIIRSQLASLATDLVIATNAKGITEEEPEFVPMAPLMPFLSCIKSVTVDTVRCLDDVNRFDALVSLLKIPCISSAVQHLSVPIFCCLKQPRRSELASEFLEIIWGFPKLTQLTLDEYLLELIISDEGVTHKHTLFPYVRKVAICAFGWRGVKLLGKVPEMFPCVSCLQCINDLRGYNTFCYTNFYESLSHFKDLKELTLSSHHGGAVDCSPNSFSLLPLNSVETLSISASSGIFPTSTICSHELLELENQNIMLLFPKVKKLSMVLTDGSMDQWHGFEKFAPRAFKCWSNLTELEVRMPGTRVQSLRCLDILLTIVRTSAPQLCRLTYGYDYEKYKIHPQILRLLTATVQNLAGSKLSHLKLTHCCWRVGQDHLLLDLVEAALAADSMKQIAIELAWQPHLEQMRNLWDVFEDQKFKRFLRFDVKPGGETRSVQHPCKYVEVLAKHTEDKLDGSKKGDKEELYFYVT